MFRGLFAASAFAIDRSPMNDCFRRPLLACVCAAGCSRPALPSARRRRRRAGARARPRRPASDPDVRVDPLQPDFNLAALPTTLRMPEHKLAFRVTHRFTRSLGRGDFGDLLNDFFGFDSGAQIGLELRYGLLPGTQIGIHRTSDRDDRDLRPAERDAAEAGRASAGPRRHRDVRGTEQPPRSEVTGDRACWCRASSAAWWRSTPSRSSCSTPTRSRRRRQRHVDDRPGRAPAHPSARRISSGKSRRG